MVPSEVPEGSGDVPRLLEGPRGCPGGVPMGCTAGPLERKFPDPHVPDPHVRSSDPTIVESVMGDVRQRKNQHRQAKQMHIKHMYMSAHCLLHDILPMAP